MVEGETHLLEPGMCFSIEPGVYLPGRFGVRIEDIVTVTEDGGRRLNNTTREMRIAVWAITYEAVRRCDAVRAASSAAAHQFSGAALAKRGRWTSPPAVGPGREVCSGRAAAAARLRHRRGVESPACLASRPHDATPTCSAGGRPGRRARVRGGRGLLLAPQPLVMSSCWRVGRAVPVTSCRRRVSGFFGALVMTPSPRHRRCGGPLAGDLPPGVLAARPGLG